MPEWLRWAITLPTLGAIVLGWIFGVMVLGFLVAYETPYWLVMTPWLLVASVITGRLGIKLMDWCD